MMRALLFCVVFLLGTGSAFADTPVYWLEFYGGTPQAQSPIDEQFQQLQGDHNISTVINVQIVEAQSSGGKIDWAPYRVVILRGLSQDFDRYFSSAAYKEINEGWITGIETITTMVGEELRADGVKFLEKAPMAALVLSPDQTEPPVSSLSLDIAKVTELKGPLSHFVPTIKQVQILPLSFDDNPMDFMPAEKSVGGLGLIGEIIR